MTSIFVAKLDFGITSEQVKQAFEDYGTVLKATVATDRETGKSRGFAFVEMAEKEEALNAIAGLDGSLMNGRPIAVKEAEARPDTRPPRDANSPRPDFNRSRENSPRPAGGFQRPDSEPREFTPPIIDPLSIEIRKKKEDKKPKDFGDTDNRAKKPKMDAYKKSGKKNLFFDDEDDDEEIDLFGLKGKEDDDWQSDDDDWEDDAFEDEDED
jgi:RNA recognition motif-containing protein